MQLRTIALSLSLAALSLAPSQARAQAAAGNAEAGKAIFSSANCALCHNADSTDKKIGPGLKGFYARGTFSGDGSKVTDESLHTFIENGKAPMPPFKDTLKPEEITNVIAYLKTL